MQKSTFPVLNIRQINARKNREVSIDDFEIPAEPEEMKVLVEKAVRQAEERSGMTARQRQALRSYRQCENYCEVARRMGITEESARLLVFRARMKLVKSPAMEVVEALWVFLAESSRLN